MPGYGTRITIPERLGCFGYYGFGTGWEKVRRVRRLRGALAAFSNGGFCNVCPLRDSCWKRHISRCDELEFVLGDEPVVSWEPTPESIGACFGEAEMISPTLRVVISNMDDGALVGLGKTPRDREGASLAWPLLPLEASDA